MSRIPSTFRQQLLGCIVRTCALRHRLIQLVAGAAAARGGLAQRTARHQVGDVTQRCVGRALGDRGPVAAGELALEPIQKSIEQLHLARV